MVFLEDIRPLSEFNRNARSFVRRLNRTGRPEVLTLNGKASVVVQDAAAYQQLIDEFEQAKTAKAIAEADRGEVIPAKQAFALLRKRAANRRKK